LASSSVGKACLTLWKFCAHLFRYPQKNQATATTEWEGLIHVVTWVAGTFSMISSTSDFLSMFHLFLDVNWMHRGGSASGTYSHQYSVWQPNLSISPNLWTQMKVFRYFYPNYHHLSLDWRAQYVSKSYLINSISVYHCLVANGVWRLALRKGVALKLEVRVARWELWALWYKDQETCQ